MPAHGLRKSDHLTMADKAAIISMRCKGGYIHDIADDFLVTHQRIQQLTKHLGIERLPNREPPLWHKILALKAKGHTDIQIQRSVKCTLTYVKRVLKNKATDAPDRI